MAGIFTQSLATGDTNIYNLIAYAYTTGAAVTSTDLSLNANGSNIATTYTATAFSGWYKLSGTFTAQGVTTVAYGVQVQTGKMAYLDDMSLNNYPSAGTLTSSIFDSGQASNWLTILYTVSAPTGSSYTVKLRTGNLSNLSDAVAFTSCNPLNSGDTIRQTGCAPNSTEFAQYQVTLSNTDTSQTPVFSSISMDFGSSASPVISNIASSPTSTSVTITWTTDQLTSSQVSYGLSSTYTNSTTVTDTSPNVTSHSVTVSGLVSCTYYHYQVISANHANVSTSSQDQTVTTSGCSGGARVLLNASSLISASAGGSIVSLIGPNIGPTITFPVGYYSSDTYIQLKRLETTPAINAIGVPSGYKLVAFYLYDFKSLVNVSTSVSSFNQIVSVSFLYHQNDLWNINETSLALFSYNGSSWSQLSSSALNTSSKTVTGQINSSAVIGLFGQLLNTPDIASPVPIGIRDITSTYTFWSQYALPTDAVTGGGANDTVIATSSAGLRSLTYTDVNSTQTVINDALANGILGIGFNREQTNDCNVLQNEESTAYTLAHAQNMTFLFAPTGAMLRTCQSSFPTQFTNIVNNSDIILYQAEGIQTDTNFSSEVQSMVNAIRAIKPAEKVWVQAQPILRGIEARTRRMWLPTSILYISYVDELHIFYDATGQYGDKITEMQQVVQAFRPPTFPTAPASSSTNSKSSGASPPVCGDSSPGVTPPYIYQAYARGNNSVRLQFSPATDPLDRYVLEFGTGSGVYQYGSPNIGGRGIGSYDVGSLSAGTRYYFRIRAGNGCATGLWSNEISATTYGTTNMLEITNSTVHTVSSTTNSSPQGYEVKIKVLDEKMKPVSGVDITIHSTVKEAKTDKEGLVDFAGIEPGQHEIDFSYNGYKGVETVDLTGNTKEFDFDIVILLKTAPISQVLMAILVTCGLIFSTLWFLRLKPLPSNLDQ